MGGASGPRKEFGPLNLGDLIAPHHPSFKDQSSHIPPPESPLGGRCEAVVRRQVPSWARLEEVGARGGASCRLGRSLAQRSGREYHETRAPWVEGACGTPHSKTWEPSSLELLKPAESGTLSQGG